MIMRTALFLMGCMSIGALLFSILTVATIHRYHGSVSAMKATLNQEISRIYKEDFVTEIDGLKKTLRDELPIVATTATYAVFTPIIEELIEKVSQ